MIHWQLFGGINFQVQHLKKKVFHDRKIHENNWTTGGNRILLKFKPISRGVRSTADSHINYLEMIESETKLK